MRGWVRAAMRTAWHAVSKYGVRQSVHSDPALQEAWDLSLAHVGGLQDHFAYHGRLNEEAEYRARLLLAGQAAFIASEIRDLPGEELTWLDVGDTDGTARLLVAALCREKRFRSVGLNIQQRAVEKIRARGLEAMHGDAMEIGRTRVSYDIVSVLETLEHLPDPIGFLRGIAPAVRLRLILSVPLVTRSRVALRYLDRDWSDGKVPTVENTHIFELARQDWEKLFWHAGWRIAHQAALRQYPSRGPGALIKYVWRRLSFEGFWLVSLVNDDQFSSQFKIE